ncbi:MAG: hypothetical protein ABSB42_15605 [Tepidisphaeraceae bacterium]|jgi:hypothetical protein
MSLAPTVERPATGKSAGRIGLVALLIGALAATQWTRDQAIAYHDSIRNRSSMPGAVASNNDTSLSSMPSFATALLLGGLRGPLVMILWTSSENQKQQRDLQDFDTKVEWIRLLQPEFDTVHLFQIWNKAYNISVQMASLRNKYTTILDAIDYGQKVEKERPDDINILTAVANLYGEKLGTSQEHVYYRSRIRRESQTLIRVTFSANRADEFRSAAGKCGWTEKDSPLEPNEQNQTDRVVIEPMIARQLEKDFTGPGVEYSPETRPESQQNDPSWRRVRLDPMLDENGRILPALLVPRYPRPADLAPSQPWYDGSQLQFLKQYEQPEPFRYGLSTLALAYNDYKKAQLLQTLWHQHHIQTGGTVVDARPAITLKDWAKDEWERGRRFELGMWDRFVPESTDPIALERPTADVAFSTPTTGRFDRDGALYSYGLAARLFHDALGEYRQHIEAYKTFATVYFVHVDDVTSGEQLMRADYDYLAASDAAGAERTRLLQSAADEYRAAMVHFAVTVLKYYVDDQVMGAAYPRDPHTGQQYNRATIESSDPNTYLQTLEAVKAANLRFFQDPATHQYSLARDTYRDDREEYLIYIGRCESRIRALLSLGIAPR